MEIIKNWILMIVRGISYRVWERVIRLGSYFFFITAILSLFLGSILILIKADFDFLSIKKNFLVKEKCAHTDSFKKKGTNPSLLVTKHIPFVPTPNILKHLTFLHHNDRPDITNSNDRSISISSSENTLLTKEDEIIYLQCDPSDKIRFTNVETPYSITPVSVKDDALLLNFEVKYKNKENKEIYHTSELISLEKNPKSLSKLDKDSQQLVNSIASAKFYGPDKLLSLMGGKEFKLTKDLPRLYFNSHQMISVKEQDRLTFENGNWVKKSKDSAGKPLFLITSIQNNQMTGTFWDLNGFYKKKMTLSLSKDPSTSIQSFNFETVYKRNNESVICKFGGRTYILKPNDWLVKKQKSWNQVHSIAEFNDLIDSKTLNEIIIFDHIEKNGDTEMFIGYIFDETRSNFKKLQIPLKKNATLRYSK